MVARFLRRLGVPDALIGDVFEQRADRSRGWLWKQFAGAVILAAMRRSASATLKWPVAFVRIVTQFRFDRVWLFALAGAASFGSVALGVSTSSTPHLFGMVAATSGGLGAVLYVIGRASVGQTDFE